MLAASYLFYVVPQPAHGALLLVATVVDYAVGLALGKAESPPARKALLGISLALNLGLLAVYKYGGFVVHNLNALLGAAGAEPLAFEGLVLPLGMSFYTFQKLSYAFDVYAGRLKPCRRLDEYALYVAFFPQLAAGPIERASHLLPQLRRMGPLTATNLSAGGRLILWGLLKKWVCADRLLAHVRPVFFAPDTSAALDLVVASIAMVVVLYLDFSAYTDIARGSARLFGIDLVKNFERTFLATSLYEWARRWHMSLVAWMYDYVWVPMVGHRVTLSRLWRANLVVMALFGLWHGASFTFLAWGLCYGVAISVHQTLRFRSALRGERRNPARRRPILAVLGWAATVLFGAQFIVLFFSPDLGFAWRYLQGELDFSRGASGTFALGTGLALAGLFALHATALLDLEVMWRRIGLAGRLALFAGGAWIALAWRAPIVEPFVYFRF
jgi:D-alanyl-lipoteichoic acid acyltransferase DltB (MBOAT superfamily)